MTITTHDCFAIFPKRCDKCNRLFWLEPYDIYYKEVGIEHYPIKCIKCSKHCAAKMEKNEEVNRIDDLINRQDAINLLKKWSDGYEYIEIETELAIKEFKYLPSAQPEPVRRGKWIHDGYDFQHGNDWIHCSECGKRGINVPADLTNYCPHCGAKMEVEE